MRLKFVIRSYINKITIIFYLHAAFAPFTVVIAEVRHVLHAYVLVAEDVAEKFHTLLPIKQPTLHAPMRARVKNDAATPIGIVIIVFN